MTSVLRASVIDIGHSFLLRACYQATVTILDRYSRLIVGGAAGPGCRPARSRHITAREHNARVPARYRKVPAGSRWKALSLTKISRFWSPAPVRHCCQLATSALLGVKIEDAARPQLAFGCFGERDQVALREDRHRSLDDRSIAPAQQHRLPARKTRGV